MKHTVRGLTVVEILIVTTVIAIIAAIRVGYSGLQERARNSARIQTASQAQTALQLLFLHYTGAQIRATIHGDTAGTGWAHVCVGADYEDGECTGNGHIYRKSTAFNALLSEVSNFNATADYPRLSGGDGFAVRGPFFQSAEIDGEIAWMLEYTLEGADRDCELSPLLWLTDPDDPSNPERTAQSDNETPWTNVDQGSDITQCMVQIN